MQDRKKEYEDCSINAYCENVANCPIYPALLGKNNNTGYSLGLQEYRDYNKAPLNWIRDVEMSKSTFENGWKVVIIIYLLYIIDKKIGWIWG